MRILPVGKSIPILVVILAGALSLSLADRVVYFTNGKAMMVKKIVEEVDGITILEIEGGGRIGVPSEQISRIEQFSVSPSSAGQARQTPPPARSAQAQPAADRAAAPNGPITAAPGQNRASRAGATPNGTGASGLAPPGRPGGPAAQQEQAEMLAARASAAALPDPGSGPIAAGQTELARPRRSTIPAVGGAQGRQGLGRSAARSGRPGVSGQLQRPGARRGGRGAGGRSRPRGQALMVEQGKPRGRDQALSQPQVGVQATVDPRDEMPLETKETPAGREADEAATKSAPAQDGSSDGASAEEN